MLAYYLLLLGYATRCLAIAFDTGGNSFPTHTPGRPPAVPLAVRTPYLSAWSGTTLNSANPIFWTGDTLGWTGVVTVDGISYEYLGNGLQILPSLPSYVSASPRAVAYDSNYSNFTFSAGPVNITASFFSPVLPKDLCRTSAPLSYLTTTVQSSDGKPHNVQFYSDINSAWIVGGANSVMAWEILRNGASINDTGNDTVAPDTMYSWTYEPESPLPFKETGDRPQWGRLAYSTQPMAAHNLSFQTGDALNLRYKYVTAQLLAKDIDSVYHGTSDHEVIFAFVHDFGNVSNAEVRYTVGLIQDPIVQYLSQGGIAQLEPWWKSCYGDMFSMIHLHWDDFIVVQELAAQAESQLVSDIEAFYQVTAPAPRSNTPVPVQTPSLVPNSTWHPSALPTQTILPYLHDSSDAYGFLNPNNFTGLGIPDTSEPDSYYAIVALSARQVMGSFVYAIPPPTSSCDESSSGKGEPLMFMKEISSDGNVNTLDVLFPTTPFFLYANPELLKYALEPIFQLQEGGYYPNEWAMHDAGGVFPNAIGHVAGEDELMPVEESGNLVLMSYAYYKFSGNSDWLRTHFATLNKSASYLLEYSKVPAAQLSTDDFAGKLDNQTNLAIKGILALQAISLMSRLDNSPGDGGVTDAIVRSYYSDWEKFGISPSRDHTLLAYQWRSSWGLLYNIYYDKLLNLGVVGKSVYTMQSRWYPTVSQQYGVPLDSRHHHTKSDWQIWAAATCTSSTRKMFVTSIAYWLNNTATQFPFADLYETIGDGGYPQVPDSTTFKARPVVGGHFALLALLRTGQTVSAEAGNTTGSLFILNGTNALNYTGTGDHVSPLASRYGEPAGKED
ncbi:glutaminase [Apiospora kogelbergensis]|uniref:glutaminase n=1 Tax=Apiospora kogelbergensis TaxID=1337665 RepID=UPI003130847A